jgi:hypothetical protein
MRVRQFEFFSAIKTNAVGPVLDREHAASVTVAAAKNKSKNPRQRIHRS